MKNKFQPQIGKNAIESLTTGMYEDPNFIFREYIQNAADQIDIAVEDNILSKKIDGKIVITIEKEKRCIIIQDNATGIKADSVLRFLGDIANSQKDGSIRKGFRGIGRLGGLGYCEKLIFETSYKNESVKSVMSLDAKQLRDIIQDRNINSDASTVISVITTIEKTKEDYECHYFKVIMENVTNDSLLDEQSVKKYLSMVAPLPFSQSFSFSNKIKNYFKKKNLIIDEYNIELNKNQIFKAYKDFLIDKEKESAILGVGFFEVTDSESEIMALGWFGYRELANKVIPDINIERGIRLRKNNIAIGNENTLKKFFKIELTNLRFIGELHVLSKSFIPNARRDYFINDNKTTKDFEKNLNVIFEKENWENLIAQNASKMHSGVKKIKKFEEEELEFKNILYESNNITEEEKNKSKERLDKSKEDALDSVKVINKIRAKFKNNIIIETLYENIVGNINLNIDNTLEATEISKSETNNLNNMIFKKLNAKESEVVIEIFSLIDQNISSIEEADNLKNKIFLRFN